MIDLGGIAKGYIADRVKAYLEERGIGHAILSFGGNIVAIGKSRTAQTGKSGSRISTNRRAHICW